MSTTTPPVQFLSVTSSNVASVAYDEGTLYVGFHVKRRNQIIGTQYYQYDNVPMQTWLDFITAPSHGKYFHQHIKDKFDFKKL